MMYYTSFVSVFSIMEKWKYNKYWQERIEVQDKKTVLKYLII